MKYLAKLNLSTRQGIKKKNGEYEMRRRKLFKVLIYVLVLGFMLQAFTVAYSLISNQPVSETNLLNKVAASLGITSTGTLSASVINTSSVIISDEIQNIIKQADPVNFDKNLNNYKTLLVTLEVHDKYKTEIERLLKENHKLPDILTAYSYLNNSYGLMEDLEAFVKLREAGKTWVQIFKEYKQGNPAFKPGNFDSNYLENLRKTPGLSTDDIMIGDRVSQKTGKPFKEVIDMRIKGTSWKDINGELDVLNGQTALPHVKVTEEQMRLNTTDGKLTEQKVVEAFVIADKLGKTTSEIINQEKLGLSKEDIYAACFESRFY